MPRDQMCVYGVIVQGYGIASGSAEHSPYPAGSIELQIPFFRKLGLDLGSCFRGTLNVSIAPHTFALQAPALTFRKVAWTEAHPPEDFSFAHCRILIPGSEYAGWVYYPHPETKKQHFHNPSLMEIIAPYIPGIGYGSEVQLALDAHEITVT